MPALVVEQPTSAGSGTLRSTEGSVASANSTLASTAVASNVSNSIPSHPAGDHTGSDAFLALDGQDQLQQLQDQLQVETRIKEGAENLLQMPLDLSLRMEVEAELEVARKKINTIAQAIESRSRKKSNELGNKHRANGHIPPGKDKDGSDERDDFHTAMKMASFYIKSLSALSRRDSVSHSAATGSPSTSPSSSTIPNPTPANEVEVNRARVETMASLVQLLKRNLRVRYELDIGNIIQVVLPALSDRASKQCRATAYQLIRHSLVDTHSVQRLHDQKYKLDWYIIKSLSRDNKYAVEKEQVIKLIRTIVEIGSDRRASHSATGAGNVPLSKAIIRSFIAIAEYPEDPFRNICLQTLTEILLVDVELVANTGGIRVLLHALADGPPEMIPMLASAFLYIIDLPRTRAYLCPGTDLEIALSGVTDAYGKGADYADHMKGCTRVIISMLRTWSGLMYFCLEDKLALRAIVDSLRIPSLETREVILDMFFDLFNIKPPEWHQAFIDGRRLTLYRKARPTSEPGPPPQPQRPHFTIKLTDQYIALLILVFCRAGLLDALTSMFEESAAGSNLSRKATLLMAEVLQTANRVLPLNMAAKIQALPRVFNLASDYELNEHRIVGTSALTAIDSYNRHRARLQPTTVKGDSRPRANSLEEAVRRNQRQVEQAKIKLGMAIDDKSFQALLLETQVMLTKDQTKWNYETLLELIEGPFLNPKRMEEAIKVSRYIKRLMSFYHPFAHRFSDLSKTKINVRWVKLGCLLLNALMSSPEGLRFLSEDDFLGQIVESLDQLIPLNSIPISDPMFSKKRMQETLTYGYFEMLGTLSKRKEGLELMERFKTFTAFYRLSELRSREDLIKSIIENLDYSIDGHSRIVFSKTLTSSYKHIRLYATNHLGTLLRGSSVANAWTLRLLLTQLYDPAVEVREVAVRFLEEACEQPDVLQTVVEMQPTLDHLGEVGHPLLLKFMSTPTGFRFLYSADYIDREMDLWFHERNLHYVVNVEVFLAKIFNFVTTDDEDEIQTLDGILATHFYGVLAKTELGCQVLREKGHFAEFADFIRQHGMESDDQDLILRLKSILWAVGNIGATEGGLPFLEEEEIIPSILEIAEQSLVFSVRGTCFFVLGLISSTPQGAEILDDYQWEATLSPLGYPTGLCVPANLDAFLSVPPWQSLPCEIVTDRLASPKTEEEAEVMTAIFNLANTVIANAASRSLAKMKSRPEYRQVFKSSSMLYRAFHAISSQKYRFPVRRYILELFDVPLDANTVKVLTEVVSPLRYQAFATGPSLALPGSSLDRPHRQRMSGSDRSSLSSNDDRPEVDKHPVMSLRPVSRIVGFEPD